MPATIVKRSDLPVIVITMESGSNVLQDISFNLSEVTRLVASQPERVFLIIETQRISIRVDEISAAASLVGGHRDALLHHPNIRETLVVSTSIVMKMSMGILNGPLFGGMKMSLYSSLEEALAYCQMSLERTSV